MRKKITKTVGIIALIIFMILFLRTGRARTDVILKDFELSSDGKSIILKVGTSSGIGYIRKMKETSGSANCYVTFYSTFGINSKIGAKDTYELKLDSEADEIYFYIGNHGYKKVLRKNEFGEWIKVIEKNN